MTCTSCVNLLPGRTKILNECVDLVAILDEFGGRLFEEMDYIQERNAERFAQLYGHLQDVYIPKIYWQYTQRRVLTMEWITGTKLTQVKQSRSRHRCALFGEVGVQCSCGSCWNMVFPCRPSPRQSVSHSRWQIGYLDFGMMSQIKPISAMA